MRRLIAPLLLSSMLVTTSCAGTYEHTAGGALVGGLAGAAGGFLENPKDTGKGAVVGIIVGALIGLAIDLVDPVK